jgi:hypothetical protein
VCCALRRVQYYVQLGLNFNTNIAALTSATSWSLGRFRKRGERKTSQDEVVLVKCDEFKRMQLSLGPVI